jgi:hypothetical protein
MNILMAELLSQQERFQINKENRATSERCGYTDLVESCSNEIMKSMILIDLIIEELRRQRVDIHYCQKCKRMVVPEVNEYCPSCK